MATEAQVRNWIEGAIIQLTREIPQIDLARVGERALCFRIGHHLASNPLDGFVVDCEYNFDVSATASKRVVNTGRLAEIGLQLYGTAPDLRLVTPDIILHSRTGDGQNNEVVIEVKFPPTSERSRLEIEYAKEKVRTIQAAFNYSHGILLTLPRVRDRFAQNCEIRFSQSF